MCARTRELAYEGTPVDIEGRVFDVLLYLIQHRDRAVSRGELEAEIWKGRPLSETVLARCIMKVRQALGDDGERQHYIRTVRGFGYRFLGEVRIETREDEGPVKWERSATSAPPGLLAKRQVWMLGAFMVLVSLLSWWGHHVDFQQRPVQSMMLALQPVSTGDGNLNADLTPLRLTLMLDRKLSSLPGVELVARPDPASAMEAGALPPDCELLVTELSREGNRFALHYRLIREGRSIVYGHFEGANPLELGERLVQRIHRHTQSRSG